MSLVEEIDVGASGRPSAKLFAEAKVLGRAGTTSTIRGSLEGARRRLLADDVVESFAGAQGAREFIVSEGHTRHEERGSSSSHLRRADRVEGMAAGPLTSPKRRLSTATEAAAPSEREKALLEAADKKLVVEAEKHPLTTEEQHLFHGFSSSWSIPFSRRTDRTKLAPGTKDFDLMLPHYSLAEIEETTKLQFDTLIVDCVGCDWVGGVINTGDPKKWKLVVFPNDSGKNAAVKDMLDRGYHQILDVDLRSGAWVGFRPGTSAKR